MGKNRLYGLLLIMIAMIAGACAGDANQPAEAVEAYLQALVSKDANKLVNASCAAWEADARQEMDSFLAVKVDLQDAHCQELSREGYSSLVACSGKIIANYGAEVLEINLADRNYQVVLEGGQWRMCGYR